MRKTRSETLLGRPAAGRHSYWKEFSQEETEDAATIHLQSHSKKTGLFEESMFGDLGSCGKITLWRTGWTTNFARKEST
jgi:hypothetical protein